MSQSYGHNIMQGRLGFFGVAYTFFIVMTGTTLPTPLYPIYGDAFGLSPFLITVIYAVYAIGVIGGLLVFGNLSDRIGRRLVLLPGVILSAGSALVFFFTGGITTLFIGRILSGLSAGLFTSTATATLVNLAPKNKQGKASMIASSVNMLGLGVGPLLAGVLAQFFAYPIRLVFVVDFIILLPAFLAIILMPEPIKTRQPFHLKIQKLRVPTEIRSTFIRAIIPVFAGFSMLGLFTAVSPTFLQSVLHIENKALLGLVVFLTFGASTIGQLIFTKTPNDTILTWGSIILVVGIVFVGSALASQSFSLLLLGAIVSGLGQAFSFRAGLASVNAKTPSQQRGEVTSSFFTIAYIALSIPVVGVGLISIWFGIQIAGIVFSIVIALLALIAFILLLKRRD